MMLKREEAIALLTTKYRGSRLDKSHVTIFTFMNGKQVAAENPEVENQKRTFSLVVNSLPPAEIVALDKDDIKHYPRGIEGGRNSNITKKDAPALWWKDHDTWRIYPRTRQELDAFLDWYLEASTGSKLVGPESMGSGSTSSMESMGPVSGIAPTIPNAEQRDPAITADARATLASDTPNLRTAEREAVVKVRFGQGSFRDALFKENNHGERCWMSGIEGRRLLIASHIKPWSHCDDDPDSRGRTDNGLLLSALWDAAFDAGLLSFAPDWKVIVSSELSESARAALNFDAQSTLPEHFRTDGRKEYLAYHHAKVFEYWKKKKELS